MNGLSKLDRQIVLATQRGLPLTAKPYHAIAEQLGIEVDLLLSRLNKMLDDGMIRRIGAVPNHYKLGFRANGMSVWDVEDKHLPEMGHRVGKLEFVSHAYHRPRQLPEWPYNLFAMVHGRTREEVLRKVDLIADMLGDTQRGYDVLFSTRILKKTGLRLLQEAPGTNADRAVA